MAKAQPLELTHDERDHLEAICRTRTIQAQIMNRARIILLKADGESVDAEIVINDLSAVRLFELLIPFGRQVRSNSEWLDFDCVFVYTVFKRTRTSISGINWRF